METYSQHLEHGAAGNPAARSGSRTGTAWAPEGRLRLIAGAPIRHIHPEQIARKAWGGAVAEEDAAQKQRRRQIKAWRRRAAQLRATADNFTIPSAQEALRRAATDLDAMADDAEAVLTGKPQRPGDVAC
jgi:hypothetical protein